MKHTIRRIVPIILMTFFLSACGSIRDKVTDEVHNITSAQQSTQEETAQQSTQEKTAQQERKEAADEAAAESAAGAEEDVDADVYPAPDFTLTDQYGVTHTLSDYKGQIVFLNFWATWCPPCRAEMPDIQKLYEEYQSSGDDSVVILGIAAPGTVDDQDVAGVSAFLKDNGYTYPVVMDLTGDVFEEYYIMAYPTTFMIDRDGNIYGYVQGMMEEDVMRDIIAQTIAGSE